MTFAEYYQTMKEHGIGEVFFLYNDKQCSVSMGIKGLNLYYIIYNGETVTSFDNLDDLVFTKCFAGKSLKDIWSEIELHEIDRVTPEKYDADTCSFNYIAYLEEQGELQWSCSLGVKKSFFLQVKYVVWGMLLVLLPMMLFPILNLSNWNILIIFSGVAAFTLLIASLALWKNKLDISYQITTKKIFVNKGIPLSTTYDNIKKVKLRKSIFNENRGTIKFYLKKGLSVNYSFEGITDCDKVYKIILENVKINKVQNCCANS